jgi:CRISPR/Cas system type I-B associated protein Csh2 (Cas7 group RAMP superfamily)
MNNVVNRRYDFVLLFDVTDGNPNGDPDAGNQPRIDAASGRGLVSDVCLKRKVRNFVQLTQAEGEADARTARAGYEIYVKERGILALQQRRAYEAQGKTGEKHDNQTATVKEARAWMCKTFYDVRTFGAVMSTGKAADEDAEPKPEKSKNEPARKKPSGAQKLWNCGQVRGPIQLSFSRSTEPILALEHAITRVALTNPGDTKRGQEIGGDGDEASSGQFGRKMTVPYALYRAHGFVSPSWPATPASPGPTSNCSGRRSPGCSSTTARRRVGSWRRGRSSSSSTPRPWATTRHTASWSGSPVAVASWGRSGRPGPSRTTRSRSTARRSTA